MQATDKEKFDSTNQVKQFGVKATYFSYSKSINKNYTPQDVIISLSKDEKKFDMLAIVNNNFLCLAK